MTQGVPVPDWKRARARALLADGMTQRDIAAYLGISLDAARAALDKPKRRRIACKPCANDKAEPWAAATSLK